MNKAIVDAGVDPRQISHAKVKRPVGSTQKGIKDISRFDNEFFGILRTKRSH